MKKILLLAVLGLLLMGCAKEESKEVTDTKKNEIVETFLTEVFTIDKDSRYETLLGIVIEADFPSVPEETGLQEAPEEVQKAYDAYYKSFEPFATKKCIESMQANRIPMKYDAHISDEGTGAEITDIKYEKVSDNSYSFEVSYDADMSNIKGKLTLETKGEQVYVNFIDIH